MTLDCEKAAHDSHSKYCRSPTPSPSVAFSSANVQLNSNFNKIFWAVETKPQKNSEFFILFQVIMVHK